MVVERVLTYNILNFLSLLSQIHVWIIGPLLREVKFCNYFKEFSKMHILSADVILAHM